MDEVAWYQQIIATYVELANWNLRTQVMTDIKFKLNCLSVEERAELVKNLDLRPLYKLLTSNDAIECGQVCDGIANFSYVSEPGHILWKYTSEIYELLSNQHNIVKVYALGEILIVASNKELLPQLLTKVDLLARAAESVGHNDVGVAQIAIKIFRRIGENPDGIKMLFKGPVFRGLAKVMTVGDVAKFRVYDIAVHVAGKSKAGLEASINSGYLHDLIRTYDTDDILLQLNVLQILCDLSTSKGGLEFLEQQGMIKKLAHRVTSVHDSPLDSMLLPGLITFFGHVAKLYPQDIFSKYPDVISALTEVFYSEDQLLVRVGIDTFAYIASTLEGKYALQTNRDLTITGLEKIGRVIEKWQSQFRVAALNALVLILTIETSEQDEKSLKLTKSWFNLICDKPLELIISLCKQPFLDMRKAGLEVLAVIASQPWGQELIAKHPGLIEFLLDRNIESFKECKEAKYAVVKNLSNSKPSLFDTETMQKLKQFVSEGPFHVDVVTEVALEGAA